MQAAGKPEVVLTIGHSTRPIEEFVNLLRVHGVERLVDVRTIPRSRHNPQFNRAELSPALHNAEIHYTHLKALGGLRHPRADSVNAGWRNSGFRGYADYMQTPEFDAGLERLLDLAARERSVIMCAEAVPWRCHRSLIADSLVVRGIPVEDILSEHARQAHKLTPFARVRGTRITYPSELPKRAELLKRAKRAKRAEEPRQAELQYETAMPQKKRPPKFTAANEARRRARETVGAPPTERVIPDKRRKPPKHKKPAAEE
jgi:hypothetical protein